MKDNHLNQFTDNSNNFRFIIEDCIHFPVNMTAKHVLVIDGDRKYEFLGDDEVLDWKRKFKEIS